jgi:hypothetical protein
MLIYEYTSYRLIKTELPNHILSVNFFILYVCVVCVWLLIDFREGYKFPTLHL